MELFKIIILAALAAVCVAWLSVPATSILSSLSAFSAKSRGMTMLANRKPSKESLTAFLPNERLPALPDKPIPGVTYLSNTERVVESHYVEGVTAYVTGWADGEGIMEELDAIAPRVPVARRFEYAGAKSGEVALSETDDIRAVGADFKVVEYQGDMTQDKTHNKGLTIILDKDNMPVGADPINRTAAKITARLSRNELRRAVTALQGLHAGTAKTWNTASPTDADADLLDLVESGADNAGIYPNTVVFDASSWVQRQKVLRALATAGGFATSALTREQLAEFLGVERVVVLRTRYAQKKGGTKNKVSDLKVMTCFQEQMPDTTDPSNVKRFVSTTEGGGEFAVYVEETAKTIMVTVEMYSKIVGVTGAGARRYNIATS